ncbi:hypothetical protein DFQ28_002738, partial [Apophysomyces sp. BC1034]
MINPYNPFILLLCRTNMDIQFNQGSHSASYLCKYVTKMDSIFDATLSAGEENCAHFHAHVVGSIEAVYDIFGWSKHKCSRDVIFLDTTDPHHKRRMLHVNFQQQRGRQLLLRTKLEYYCARPHGIAFEELTYPQYFA